MANSHKYSVQESLNTGMGTGGEWTVNTVSTVHASTATGSTVHLSVSSTAGQIGVYSAGAIYFRFGVAGSSGTEDDCSTSHDLLIPATTLTFITVPRGLGKNGNSIYFNHLGVAACAVRIVEV